MGEMSFQQSINSLRLTQFVDGDGSDVAAHLNFLRELGNKLSPQRASCFVVIVKLNKVLRTKQLS